ncbi:hypothetical protein VMCG_01299 [Cytospora schulzeri]|uniref:Uncharacterized protein n=1 Tax=Cytospora schulzeri TaxID=448051 RepID=A0A423X711_9PEZI|nr:hypothetical protein VMCG_01299 [Valsa malicola]
MSGLTPAAAFIGEIGFSTSQSALLPVREVAMMGIMDRLTDKKDWHKKVFDDAIVEKWREEAMSIPDEEYLRVAAAPNSDWEPGHVLRHVTSQGLRIELPTRIKGIMSRGAFDYCIQELRSKAKHFEQTGIVPTLDASTTIIKSDKLVKDDLRESLRSAFRKLQDDQADHPDWHPGSNNMVQDLVHPSMYPLIYGRSRVLEDEVVGVSDAVEKWAGKGTVIEKDMEPARQTVALGDAGVPRSYWSNAYQWLPSNVLLQEDGSVKFASYINNLHPTKYPDIYSTIEKLIQTALPAWDHCLLENKNWRNYGPGRKGSRFPTPDNADDDDVENWDPSDPAELADVDIDPAQAWMHDHAETEEERKWWILRSPVLREPAPFREIKYDPYGGNSDDVSPGGYDLFNPPPGGPEAGTGDKPTAQTLKGGLQAKFKDLQVIVKMASIELTPENPEFPAGGWHIEGQINESICATALYYLDSENVTDSSLSFRMHTSYDQWALQKKVGQDRYHWLECCYGTSLGNGGVCIQNYGSVQTPEGRLLAFPNVYQHRVSPFKLADPTKPGHRRFIALWLVDPHRRIVSTANVPPQQQDWWTESVFGKSEGSQKSAADKPSPEIMKLLRERGVALSDKDEKASLPAELLSIVRKELDWSMLSPEEAKEHRLKLMEERSNSDWYPEESRQEALHYPEPDAPGRFCAAAAQDIEDTNATSARSD